jgi:hypothetical protein
VEEVKVVIDEQGNVKITVFGAHGPSCLKITEEMERLLGGQVQREFTSEYYQQEEKESTRIKEKV